MYSIVPREILLFVIKTKRLCSGRSIIKTSFKISLLLTSLVFVSFIACTQSDRNEFNKNLLQTFIKEYERAMSLSSSSSSKYIIIIICVFMINFTFISEMKSKTTVILVKQYYFFDIGGIDNYHCQNFLFTNFEH